MIRVIVGMQHGGVYCRDIDESIGFYEGLGFRLLFRSDAMEGEKPLKMAWVKAGENAILELIEQADKSTCDAAEACLNHIALRVDDMDAFVELLGSRGVAIEAGPFDPPLEFDRPLEPCDAGTFTVCGDGGAKLRIMFFRGPGGERFEVVQDDVGAL